MPLQLVQKKLPSPTKYSEWQSRKMPSHFWPYIYDSGAWNDALPTPKTTRANHINKPKFQDKNKVLQTRPSTDAHTRKQLTPDLSPVQRNEFTFIEKQREYINLFAYTQLFITKHQITRAIST